MYASDEISSVYGRRGIRLSPVLAAFVNGVAVSRWNRWVTVVESTADRFRHTKSITKTKFPCLNCYFDIVWSARITSADISHTLSVLAKSNIMALFISLLVVLISTLIWIIFQSHSMDFDDTWHPATHPSGAVLPAVLALSDMMPANSKPSGLDLLLAFNVGIEIQGRLMRFSNEASNIPMRWAPQSNCT